MTTSQQSERTPAHGTFCWNELTTSDMERSITFYTSLFGWKTERMDMGESGTYTVMKAGAPGSEQSVGGVATSKAGDDSYWTAYVAVDDINTSVALAQSLGAKIIEPVDDIPNVGRFAIIEDPAGARIALFQGG